MQATFRTLSLVGPVTGMRPAIEVVPKLGPRPAMPALRIGGPPTYDRPIEHLAGQLDISDLKPTLRSRDARYGMVLCFALEPVALERLAKELVRVAHRDGAVWMVVWKRNFLAAGAPSWEEAQAALLATGWVDNKVLSLGERVYATRYVRRRRPGKGAPSGGSRR